MRRFTLAATLAVLAGLPGLSGHSAEQTKLNALMQRKLVNAQKVLAAVTMNDFKAVRKHAEELIDISREAEFKVIKTPRYEMLAEDFRRTEPSSPISYTLEEAVRRARLSWPDLLRELIPELPPRSSVLVGLGIRAPSE